MSSEELRHGIHHRHLVIQKGREVVLCVIELEPSCVQCGEISFQHLRGEQTGRAKTALMTAHALVVTKEKELIADNRPAESCAEYLLRVGVLGGNRIVVVVAPGVGIEFLELQ